MEINVTTAPDYEMVSAIRQAARDCHERGLMHAAKWASDLALSVPRSLRTPLDPNNTTHLSFTPAHAAFDGESPAMSASPTAPVPKNPLAPVLLPWPANPEEAAQEAVLEAGDADAYTSARACMDAKEFQRAVYMLQNCKSRKASFLSSYCQFMAAEKKALNDWHLQDAKRGQSIAPVNRTLQGLVEQMQNASDPWHLFLKALYLRRLSRREEAIEAAILSISMYPWNWSTWLVLSDCINDVNELASLLPLIPLSTSHPLIQFLILRFMLELQTPAEDELAMCDRLLQPTHFPTSCWIMAMKANVLYNLHDFSAAQKMYEQIVATDPFRIEDIDIYSNILYVQEDRIKLSRLAKEFLGLDKDRPETCCVVGNHYSLRGEHERAIKYFKRAVLLDRTYTSAWTLIGHEYVEMKNSHAAIESYRRAVDTNRKDYRAWFGLGQAYELLNMHQYALHYFHKATALRPYDTRMWQAQGQCYDELGRTREAVECMKRALIGADPQDTNILTKIANMFNSEEDYPEAAAYHRRIVEVSRAAGKPTQDWARSALYVAHFHSAQGGGDLQLAQEYLEKVAQSNAEEVKLAADMLKRVNKQISMRADAANPAGSVP